MILKSEKFVNGLDVPDPQIPEPSTEGLAILLCGLLLRDKAGSN